MNMQVTANQEVETNGRVPYLERQRKRGDLSASNLNMGLFLLSSPFFPFLSPRESLVETNHFWVVYLQLLHWRSLCKVQVQVDCRSTCALKSTEPQLPCLRLFTFIIQLTHNLTKKKEREKKCAIYVIRVNKPDQAVPASIWSSLHPCLLIPSAS